MKIEFKGSESFSVLLVCLTVACGSDAIEPASIPGAYALNRRTGADSIVLDATGRYRHRWRVDETPVEGDSGSWTLITEPGGRKAIVLADYSEWWGMTGDPDRRREKAERYGTATFPLRTRAGRVEVIVNPDEGLRYVRVEGAPKP